MISKKDVPEFGPRIRSPFIFKKNERLKKFILSKLINAEYASLRAPAFSFYSEKTLESSLQKLYENLILSTRSFVTMLTFSPTSLVGLMPDTSNIGSVSPSESSLQISTTSSNINNKLTVRGAFRKFSTHYFKAENNPYLTADPLSSKSKESNNRDEDEYINRSKDSTKKEKIVKILIELITLYLSAKDLLD